MRIEAARAIVDKTPLPLAAAEELRHRARLRSTHYSTRIEGNRLTLEEAAQVIAGQPIQAVGRERDVREVQHYWDAFLQIEAWSAQSKPISEDAVRKLHALVEHGRRAKPTPYRDGQNVIRDSSSGRIVYLPPVWQDVPLLMSAMTAWSGQAEREQIPAPLIAGLLHYQFVTIHPFYDGNGRTARLLATWQLHRSGYGLGGIFSLEEYHARDLDAYYGALVTHLHHNDYEGRSDAELTAWLEYFVQTLARVFVLAEEEAQHIMQEGLPTEPNELRRLDARTRRVLSLFARADKITARDVANLLGIAERTARVLLTEWVNQGVLIVANTSKRARAYELSAIYRQFIGSLSAVA